MNKTCLVFAVALFAGYSANAARSADTPVQVGDVKLQADHIKTQTPQKSASQALAWVLTGHAKAIGRDIEMSCDDTILATAKGAVVGMLIGEGPCTAKIAGKVVTDAKSLTLTHVAGKPWVAFTGKMADEVKAKTPKPAASGAPAATKKPAGH